MMNLSVRARLLMLLAFVNALLVVAAGYSWFAIARLNDQFTSAMQASQRISEAADLSRRAQVDFKIQVQEWKDTLLRGQDPELFEKYMKAFRERSARVHDQLTELGREAQSLGLPADFAATTILEHEELNRKYLAAIKQYRAGDAASVFEVDKSVRGIDRAATAHIDDLVKQERERGAQVAAAAIGAAAAEKTFAVTGLAVLALCALTVSAILGWLTLAPITRRLSRASEVAQAVAGGDLTARIEPGRLDEIGQLLAALATMNGSLSGVVSRVRDSAETVATASAQIAAANSDLSSRTEEQASSLEETASSIEEMTAVVGQNAQSAGKASDAATQAADTARRGGKAVDEVVLTIDGMQESSRRIGEIIGVIDSIAFQTNILALNAAVEAARAGEQGRGFAVVAAEVRVLAQRTAEAAREIKGLIADTVSRVDSGAAKATEAGKTMADVVSSVQNVSTIISDIAAATREQNSGILQVNQAVTQLDKVTQSNAALVEESASASEQLKRMARQMAETVAFFKTPDEARPAGAEASQRRRMPSVASHPAPHSSRKRAGLVTLQPVEEGWTEF